MYRISIPKPCHEDWEKMTPRDQGRHCDACAKTVVDFTNMSDDEVQNFFLNNNGKVCGRVNNSQLARIVINISPEAFKKRNPIWKRVLVASLIIFSTTLFSCDTQINGQSVNYNNVSEFFKGVSNSGSYQRKDIVVGNLAIPYIPDSIKVKPPVVTTVCTVTQGEMWVEPIQPEIKGEIAIMPVIDSPVIQKEMIKKDTMKCDPKTFY